MENRIIKFRAWDDSIKKFVNPTYNNAELEDIFLLPFYQFSQFTGLTDCNGKEIWEGDIIKWDDNSGGRYWRFAVVEQGICLYFNCKPIKKVDGVKNSTDHSFPFVNFIYKDTSKHIEVIGNIFEHPQLLNK